MLGSAKLKSVAANLDVYRCQCVSKLIRAKRHRLRSGQGGENVFDQTQQQNPYDEAIAQMGIGAFALLPGHQQQQGWLVTFLQQQLGQVSHHTAVRHSQQRLEQVSIEGASWMQAYGMQLTLYPDLLLMTELDQQADTDYSAAFAHGSARYFHLAQSHLLPLYQQHIATEIRYIAVLIKNAQGQLQLDKIWPVEKVCLVAGEQLSRQQTGRPVDVAAFYYLFYLGSLLRLDQPRIVQENASQPFHPKLTRLQYLQQSPPQYTHVYQQAWAD